MCGMTHVQLVRHGEADYRPINDRGWPGLAAELAPLTDAGIAQAVAAADELAGAAATYLVSAPATRSLQTAAVIGHRLALGVRVEFELREWLPNRTGSWRGLADVKAALRDFDACDGEWPAGITRPWEPRSDVRDRATAALRRHLDAAGGAVIAVTHAMVIGALTGDADVPHGSVRRHLLLPDVPDLATNDA
jgi:broad specificity phosphatase PhoE